MLISVPDAEERHDEVGLFALLAVRRTALTGWQRAVVVVALVGLGDLVVLLKTLGH
jgi:hypothetical protein